MAKTQRGPGSAGSEIQPERQAQRSSNFTSLYANDVQIQMSAWDMRIIFGEIGEPATRENPIMSVTQVGEVRISPQLAKRWAAIMATQIAEYEANFGTIPVPI